MRAIDTNLLVRLLARDDAPQVDAAERFIAEGAWVSHLVLMQCLWVLERAYRLDRTRIAMVVDMLLSHTTLVVDRPDIIAHAIDLYRSASRVGFSDCLILATAVHAGHTPLGTFDKALIQLPRTERVD